MPIPLLLVHVHLDQARRECVDEIERAEHALLNAAARDRVPNVHRDRRSRSLRPLDDRIGITGRPSTQILQTDRDPQLVSPLDQMGEMVHRPAQVDRVLGRRPMCTVITCSPQPCIASKAAR